jgi:hypothetical protein
MSFFYLQKAQLSLDGKMYCLAFVAKTRADLLKHIVYCKTYSPLYDFIEIPQSCVYKIYGKQSWQKFSGSYAEWILPWPGKIIKE